MRTNGYKISKEEIALELTKLYYKNFSCSSVANTANTYLEILQKISEKKETKDAN